MGLGGGPAAGVCDGVRGLSVRRAFVQLGHHELDFALEHWRHLEHGEQRGATHGRCSAGRAHGVGLLPERRADAFTPADVPHGPLAAASPSRGARRHAGVDCRGRYAGGRHVARQWDGAPVPSEAGRGSTTDAVCVVCEKWALKGD